jgi:hypothetical protein
MKKADLMFTCSFLLVTSSFWIFLAWAYFTNQSMDSFYVGPAVVGVAITFFIDVFLILFGITWATIGLMKKQVLIQQVALRWFLLLWAPIASYFLANQASILVLGDLYK